MDGLRYPDFRTNKTRMFGITDGCISLAYTNFSGSLSNSDIAKFTIGINLVNNKWVFNAIQRGTGNNENIWFVFGVFTDPSWIYFSSSTLNKSYYLNSKEITKVLSIANSYRLPEKIISELDINRINKNKLLGN